MQRKSFNSGKRIGTPSKQAVEIDEGQTGGHPRK